LHREGIDQFALEAALREHGVENVKDVEMAVLEVDGSISVIPTGTEMRTLKKPLKYLTHK